MNPRARSHRSGRPVFSAGPNINRLEFVGRYLMPEPQQLPARDRLISGPLRHRGAGNPQQAGQVGLLAIQNREHIGFSHGLNDKPANH